MSAPEQPIDTRSVQGRVYESIREAMRKGVFTWGQTVTIRALAARFGTSEMPVREAIKRLVAEKALEQQSDRTFKVPPINPQKFDELLLARAMIEGRAAEIATLRLSPELLQELHAINREMEIALTNHELMVMLEKNQQFHFKLYEASENETLMELIEMLWLRSGPYLAALAADEAGAHAYFDAVDNHNAILDALEARNGQEAAAALRKDMETSVGWFRRRMSQHWKTPSCSDQDPKPEALIAMKSP